jgi:hypothetical protein
MSTALPLGDHAQPRDSLDALPSLPEGHRSGLNYGGNQDAGRGDEKENGEVADSPSYGKLESILSSMAPGPAWYTALTDREQALLRRLALFEARQEALQTLKQDLYENLCNQPQIGEVSPDPTH